MSDETKVEAKPATDDAIAGILRGFPQFANGEEITPEALQRVVAEHIDMIMTWAPIQDRIEFTDDNGEKFAIVFDSGDDSVGVVSDWCVPEDADWFPSRRAPTTEATDDKDAIAIVAEALAEADGLPSFQAAKRVVAALRRAGGLAEIDALRAKLAAAGFVIVPREPIARAHTAFTCVMQWINNWSPAFTEEDEWTGDEEIAAKALRDLDAMVSAEGKQ